MVKLHTILLTIICKLKKGKERERKPRETIKEVSLNAKIVSFWLRNKNNTCQELSNEFKIPLYSIEKAIDEYIKEPYIIRESKMNYE